jgi:hypothetical protein
MGTHADLWYRVAPHFLCPSLRPSRPAPQSLTMHPPTPFFAQFSCPLTSASHPDMQRPSSLREPIPPTAPKFVSQFFPLLFLPSYFVARLCPMTLALHAVDVLQRSGSSSFLYCFLDFRSRLRGQDNGTRREPKLWQSTTLVLTLEGVESECHACHGRSYRGRLPVSFHIPFPAVPHTPDLEPYLVVEHSIQKATRLQGKAFRHYARKASQRDLDPSNRTAISFKNSNWMRDKRTRNKSFKSVQQSPVQIDSSSTPTPMPRGPRQTNLWRS